MTPFLKWVVTAALAIASHTAIAGPAPDQLTPVLRGCGQTASLQAQVELTNEGIIDQTKVDNAKTEIQVLGVEKLAKGRSKQIFHLVLHQFDGKSVAIIVISTLQGGECPADAVSTYLISRKVE